MPKTKQKMIERVEEKKNTFRMALVLSGEQGERIFERITKAGMLGWRKSANMIISELCDKAGI
jgi:Fe-S cluster biosynthesis and repair protein YggX